MLLGKRQKTPECGLPSRLNSSPVPGQVKYKRNRIEKMTRGRRQWARRPSQTVSLTTDAV
jgi:hypothetical protein